MDLTKLLREWPHESGRVNARKITGDDGREKLQVRVELGVLQMEMTGRPDGLQPDGAESLLALHRARLETYIRETGGPDGFVLSPDDCRGLRDEAVQYYHRYIGLMAVGDYPNVIRDTTRNLEAFDLCRDYASEDSDRHVLEQFRPYVITMRARAEAEGAVGSGRPQDALQAIDRALALIRDLFDEHDQLETYEQSNEVQLLRGMRDALVPKLPVSQRNELHERLQAALANENYELAAILRDELRLLREDGPTPPSTSS